MAQQPAANESIPLLASDPLYPTMEQQVEGRKFHTNSISPGSNTTIQPSIEGAHLSSSTLSRSSIRMQLDHEDESTPLLLSASQHSTMEQQQEGRGPNPRATFNSPRVEDENTKPFFSSPIHTDIEQQREHSPFSLSTSGELSPDTQHNVGDDTASNTFAQQAEIQQHRSFSLSDPTQSTIMLRRSAHAESASAGRSSDETMQNVNPKRVKHLISILGFDDQLSEMLYRLVIATAPFHNTESLLTPPAPEESNPKAEALREALGNLMFAPESASPTGSPTATTAEEGSIAGNSTDNPTGELLFDANAAENLGSCPLEPCSDPPPMLWSTAAAEESLDPNAKDPTYFTVAEFINTIVENNIQVESVTEQDWWIEEVRVAILNRLKHDASEEDLAAEEDSNEVVMTKEEATEQVKATAKEDTSKSDLQRWKEQGPENWLKRDDGTDMSEEQIDEECARWDAMVRNARKEKEAEEAAPSLGKDLDLKDKGFWEFVRSSKQKEQTQGSISTHGQDEKISVSTHDQDEEASQKKNKKGSRKNKNKNRKAKKNALKGGDPEDVSEEVRDMGTFSRFMDLPTQVRNKVLGFVLVVHQELVPYHYVNGKVVKNVGLRKKPELNILLALCSSKDKAVKKCLDDAKNILYRDNTFSIRKPNDLILFLGMIGGDNVARMKMGKNLLLTDAFFDKKRRYELEMKWLARWGKDLLFAMKGHNIYRSDIAAENSEDDLTCEPTDIEKALKSMVEVMKDEGKMYETLKGIDDGSGSSPVRLQSLDLGEKFDSLAEQIETMGLAVGDGMVTKSETTKTPETDAPDEAVESMSEKWKRKAREAGEKVKDEGDANRYGEYFLKVVTSLDEGDEDDILSQDSGFYTPSVYSERGKNPTSTAK
ncbi:hypothetical protein HO133_010109 [Letharia lupina]|uniref:Uncharacterized protein n=1 Tax=Letharia lupina TaxID=560253 RepID=A0A8H6FE17_9LECA|nr:uncharacterized protein HO133_010109 [Letharia lupina]KAF6224915.1 hypothetical protein HO133_010109 [Letharia lupina]